MKKELLPMKAAHGRESRFSMIALQWRITAVIAGVAQLLATGPFIMGAQALAATESTPPASAGAATTPSSKPEHIKVKKGTLQANPAPLAPSFTAPVTDAQITKSNILEEVLAPIGKTKTSTAENAALAAALLAYSRNHENIAGLERFVASHPHSAWNASVLTNLGIIYRHTGYYSKALDAWHKAWALSQNEKEYPKTVVADRAVAGLAHLLSNIGRTEELKPLLDSIQNRPLGGTSATEIRQARSALGVMFKQPGISFKCGPFALGSIQRQLQGAPSLHPILRQAQSSTKGFSLAQLQDLSKQVGMDFQMAKRGRGAPLLVPSVVHWNVGHYAAILKKVDEGYIVRDPTFGHELVLKQEAIDAEASGYYLVPAGSLPSGWTAVSDQEGAKVWGRGMPEARDGSQTKPTDKKPPCPPGMPVASILLLLACLHITDTPMVYNPPVGPSLSYTVTYNQYEASQTGAFTTSNLGNNWINPWQSYIKTVDARTVVLRGGGSEDYAGLPYVTDSTGGKLYGPQIQLQTTLYVNGNYYERRFPDGSKEIFNSPMDGHGYVYLTSYVDPQGNTITFQYESVTDGYRLKHVLDSLGQQTTLNYGLATDDLKITSIQDPFGRVVNFGYTVSGGKAQLTSITDVVGITSQFTYAPGTDAITAMTTPYGKTTFDAPQAIDGDVELTITDPNGGKEKALARYGADASTPTEPAPNVPFAVEVHPGIPGDNVLDNLNTYFWDKKAMMDAPGDLSKAHIYHWLLGAGAGEATGVLYCEKPALESRIWYNYARAAGTAASSVGTSDLPTGVARLLEDGSTQYTQFTYNSVGMLTQKIDPLNRQTNYTYATNGIDLTAVNGPNGDVLGVIGYNPTDPPHLPHTVTDASGQPTTYTYTSFGQVSTVTNAKGEITTFNYDGTTHYLTSIVENSATNTTASATLAYDDYGRVSAITVPDGIPNSNGYTIGYQYDALNRPTVVTYPDGTYEQTVYNVLDEGWKRDRLGRWTTFYHDAVRNLVAVEDPLGQLTRYGYCSCGALVSLVDPAGNATSWTRDIERRPLTKTYADGSKILYHYDLTGRLDSVTDAKGQVKKYSFYTDDDLKEVDYLNAQVSTPSVSFQYDTNYNWLTLRHDGMGDTHYTHSLYSQTTPPALTTGAGRLATETGPLGAGAAVSYGYDELGRTVSRTIGAANSDNVSFDHFGRITGASNALGGLNGSTGFTYSYAGLTDQLSEIDYPNQQRTTFAYYPNVGDAGTGNGDQRLQQIQNLNSTNGVISQFGYTYDPAGRIATWSRETDVNPPAGYVPTTYTFENDNADQLKGAVLRNSSTSDTVHKYFYGYDSGANRTSIQIDNQVTKASYNAVNQLGSTQGGGPLRFSGTLNEPATVAIGGKAATVTTTAQGTTFSGNVDVVPGNNNVVVSATDNAGLTTTHTYQVNVAAGQANQSFAYDQNGNMVSDGVRTFGWDAENRLVKVTTGGHIQEFVYNGIGQRVAEKMDGAMTRQWVWDGMTMREERDATGATVNKQFYRQGEQIGGVNYYYTRDHLGSIRELVDSDKTVRARYDYDSYGQSSGNLITNTGDPAKAPLDADFGFTGHYWNAFGRLNLTFYRGYNPDLGRWLSRDPVEESRGVNVYRYVGNNPVENVDPLGLWQFTISGGEGWAGRLSFGNNGGSGWAGFLNGQWNLSAGIGAGAGISISFDPSSQCQKSGYGNFLDVSGSIGEGDVGAGFDANADSNQGSSITLNGRFLNAGKSWTATPNGSVTSSGGYYNYGASFFAGVGTSYAQ